MVTAPFPAPVSNVTTRPYTPEPNILKYRPSVERWRPLVSKHFKPEDVDKALYVIDLESGGDDQIRNSEGSGATGLFQIMPFHGINATDPEASVAWAAHQVYNVRGNWGDWGEA